LKRRMDRGRFLCLAAALAVTLAGLLLVSDAGLYSKTIVKVTAVQTRSAGQSRGENGVTEKKFTQQITAVVRNGAQKGKTVTFSNDYTASQTKTTRYRTGDSLFVRLDGSRVTVLSVKRDAWLVGLAGLFACTLFYFYRGRGFLILLSVAVNVGLMAFVLVRGSTDAFFAWQWPILIAAFCVGTLLLVGGFRRQTLGTILSTLLTALLVALLYQLTVNRSSVIPYDMMEDTLGSAPIEDIFRFSVIAGSIGAIMDVAVAIHASVDKMAADGTLPEGRALRASLREIGGDVMGTMINVLFFSYISASLPICVLKIASGYAVTSIFNYDLIFDFTRFLLGAIGIVLTIPVSEGVALAMCRGKRRRRA
jgi:uncharacterized membrane protein